MDILNLFSTVAAFQSTLQSFLQKLSLPTPAEIEEAYRPLMDAFKAYQDQYQRDCPEDDQWLCIEVLCYCSKIYDFLGYQLSTTQSSDLQMELCKKDQELEVLLETLSLNPAFQNFPIERYL